MERTLLIGFNIHTVSIDIHGKTNNTCVFLHRATEVFVANLNPNFEANFNQRIFKILPENQVLHIFHRKVSQNHTLTSHFPLFWIFFFAKIPFIISMSGILLYFFAISFFKKTLLSFFLPFFYQKKMPIKSKVMRFQIF